MFPFPVDRAYSRPMDKTWAKSPMRSSAPMRPAAGINNVDGANLPSKRAVAAICDDLLQLLFPGFHDAEPIHSQHLPRVTAHRVFTIAERLAEEVCKSQRLGDPNCPNERADASSRAISWAASRTCGNCLKTDVEAAFDGDPAAGGLGGDHPCLSRSSRPSPSSAARTSSTATASRSSRG